MVLGIRELSEQPLSIWDQVRLCEKRGSELNPPSQAHHQGAGVGVATKRTHLTEWKIKRSR